MRPADRPINPAVAEYLAALPPERRDALEAIRAVILERLPPGYEESFGYGMLVYQVPLAVYPDTYNGQPFMYAALASQKQHISLYLMAVYGDDGIRDRFLAAWRASGHRLDMGKSCVRFRRLDDVPLDVVGDAIAAVPMDRFVARAKELHAAR